MISNRNAAARALLALAIAAAAGLPAAAEIPAAAAFLADVGFDPKQVAQVEAGGRVAIPLEPSHERELVAGFAFLVHAPQAELVQDLRTGLLDRVDPNTIAFQMIPGAAASGDFAKLALQPGAQKRAQSYVGATPGGDLNLSREEIAAFVALGSGAPVSAVEQTLRSTLLVRLQAYQSKGLAGIAPYARSGAAQRSVSDDLRAATVATKRLHTMAPAAQALLLRYPASKPPGTEETFRWSHFAAHGVPTIALTHSLYVPDGDAWVVVQRQFYVSSGYNCEQAVAALLPMQEGTLVVYSNRTSTDQVTGFGGGAKRSIGSKLLASQLAALHQKLQARGKGAGR